MTIPTRSRTPKIRRFYATWRWLAPLAVICLTGTLLGALAPAASAANPSQTTSGDCTTQAWAPFTAGAGGFLNGEAHMQCTKAHYLSVSVLLQKLQPSGAWVTVGYDFTGNYGTSTLYKQTPTYWCPNGNHYYYRTNAQGEYLTAQGKWVIVNNISAPVLEWCG